MQRRLSDNLCDLLDDALDAATLDGEDVSYEILPRGDGTGCVVADVILIAKSPLVGKHTWVTCTLMMTPIDAEYVLSTIREACERVRREQSAAAHGEENTGAAEPTPATRLIIPGH